MSLRIHMLLLLPLAATYAAIPVSSNETGHDFNRFEYYEKKKGVSPLEILLQDDHFLRNNAEKHGYIDGEWAGLLDNSTNTIPCSKNPRLNNPDCIKNGKHSYSPILKDNKKFEDKHTYDLLWHYPRVSPALAHTEKYMLGKRRNDVQHKEFDTFDRIRMKPSHKANDRDHHIINTEALGGEKTHMMQENSQLHTTPELSKNTSYTEENSASENHARQSHSNMTYRTGKTNNFPDGIEQDVVTRPSTEKNLEISEYFNSSEHNSVSGSNEKPVPNKSGKEETTTGVKEIGPYGQVDNNRISQLNGSKGNELNNEKINEADRKLINETSKVTPSNVNEVYGLTNRPLNDSKNNANIFKAETSEYLTVESTNSGEDLAESADSSATEPLSDELKGVDRYGLAEYGKMNSNNYTQSNNMPNRTEQLTLENITETETPKSDDRNTLTDPLFVNNETHNEPESPQNKTHQFQKPVTNGNMPETYAQSETNRYGLDKPVSLIAQNTSGKQNFFVPSNNQSFPNKNQMNSNSSETTQERDRQNLTGHYGSMNSTSVNVNNTVPSTGNDIPSTTKMPFDNIFITQAESNDTLLKEDQNEIGSYGLVDSVTVNFKSDKQENSFNLPTTKPDNKLDLEPEPKQHSEIGPYGLADSASLNNNLKLENNVNISSDVETSLIKSPYEKHNETSKLVSQTAVPHQIASQNETSNQTKDTNKCSGKKNVETQTPNSQLTSSNSERNDSLEDVNTYRLTEPTFRILPHASVGNYSTKQLPFKDGTDKKHPQDLIQNSEPTYADRQVASDEETCVIPLHDTSVGTKSNKSLLILEFPEQLCYCDSGKPVKGFKLIPF